MNNDYYQKEIFLAQVDEKDNITRQIERWEAHEKGILHRGFTAILEYKDKILIQHRKHPAFDGFWDLTFSSHQIFENGHLQSDIEAIYKSLEREWNLDQKHVESISKKGIIYYKAKDPRSIYTEHEIDHIYIVRLKSFSNLNPEYAYGYEKIKSENIDTASIKYDFAPWVKKMINEGMFRA